MEIKRQNKGKTIKNAHAKSSLPASNVTWGPMLFLFCFLESQKDENDLNEEREIFSEMMQVIDQRDRLVDSLEEQRIKEKAEDQHFESFIFSRGCQLSRTWAGPRRSPWMLAEGEWGQAHPTHSRFLWRDLPCLELKWYPIAIFS